MAMILPTQRLLPALPPHPRHAAVSKSGCISAAGKAGVTVRSAEWVLYVLNYKETSEI